MPATFSLPLKRYWDLLVTYLNPQWLKVTLLAILLLSTIGLQLLSPQLLRSFIDTARAGGVPAALMRIAAVFTGVALLQQLTSILATYIGETVGWTATNALRRDVALHCLRLDMTFHNTHTPGELIERIDGDVTALANFFSQFVVRVLGNLLLLVGVLALLLWEDWRIGSAFTALAVVALLLLNSMRDLAAPHWAAGRQASADMAGFLEERLAGTEDIRSSGATAYKMRRLFILMRNLRIQYRKARVASTVTGVTARLFFVLAMALGLVLGSYLYSRGTITIGTVFLITYYAQILSQPLEQITDELQDLQKATASISRVQELQRARSVLKQGTGTPLPLGALAVELDHVSFGYKAEEPVLHDISLQLTPGRVLGLLGRTGSGKTTITRLLFRLYDPRVGVVRLGGVDVRQAHEADMRQRIAMVTQEVQLFHATLRDNLRLWDQTISDELIFQAIKELGLETWYWTLSDGLDTMLEAHGGGLSAGEAQLVAFTRVLLKDPGLVILDEASSRLDPATEALFEGAVERLIHGRTAIIVAHRLRTVQRADEIMILEHGRIAEHGRREQLQRDPDSRFAQLLRTGMEEALA